MKKDAAFTKSNAISSKKYDDTPTLLSEVLTGLQSHVFGAPFYYIDNLDAVAFQFAENMKTTKRPKKYNKLVSVVVTSVPRILKKMD